MNKTIALGAATILSVLALQPALAQSSSSEASSASSEASSAMSSEPSSAMSSEPSAEPANKANFGGLISALQAGKMTADLTTITDTTVVNVVTVSSLSASADAKALDNALDKNKAAVDQLRVDVSANAALSAKLTAGGYAAEDVVAVVTEADGSVTLYVDDRA